jgi:hypothetical protein
MSFWHEHSLADAHRAELQRQAEVRHRAAHRRTAIGPVRWTRVGARSESAPTVRQRAGILLVEAGLHLITVTDGRRSAPQRGLMGSARISR